MDAYKLDGTRLWRIDLGRNIRAGAHYNPFLVYDFDGDSVWGAFTGKDTGRGLVGDIDPNYAGDEVWGASNLNVWSAKGEVLGQVRPSMNFAIWWDGDPLRENSGYNQPPHPSFFIGNNMPNVARPKVFVSPVPDLIGHQDDDDVYVVGCKN